MNLFLQHIAIDTNCLQILISFGKQKGNCDCGGCIFGLTQVCFEKSRSGLKHSLESCMTLGPGLSKEDFQSDLNSSSVY